jgi:hypothetical protein
MIEILPGDSNNFPTVALEERDIVQGKLRDAIEAEERTVAQIGSRWVELPKELSEKVWGLMGQWVRVGLFEGEHRIGAQT